MHFKTFLASLPAIRTAKIDGLEAQFKLAPKMREKYSEEFLSQKQARLAAVLALFYPDAQNETCFLLTERAQYNGTHSAQISFPGGKKDQQDNSIEATALRETFEEVHVESNTISIVRSITDVYIPPSNFLVAPFIGYSKTRPNFIKNEEVASLIEVRLSDLLNDSYIKEVSITTSYATDLKVPCFYLNNHVVWGATAMMLNEIKELIQAS